MNALVVVVVVVIGNKIVVEIVSKVHHGLIVCKVGVV